MTKMLSDRPLVYTSRKVLGFVLQMQSLCLIEHRLGLGLERIILPSARQRTSCATITVRSLGETDTLH